jgi:drug/metabolite transporter (DMT)-like permease
MTAGISLAVLAAVLIGTGDFIGGVLGRRDPTPASLVAVFAWMVTVSVPIALFLGSPFTTGELLGSIGLGVCWLVGFYAIMMGIAEGKVVVVVPIAGVVSVAIPVAIDAARGVRPTTVAGIGVVVGMTAVAIVGLGPGGEGTRSRQWSAAMGLVGGIATGLAFTFLDQATGAGIWPVAVASLVALLLAVGFLSATRRRLWVARGGLVPSIALAVLFLASFSALLAAFTKGTLTIVSVVASQYPAVTLGLAALIWRQRPRGIQYLGAALALVSLALIAVGSA